MATARTDPQVIESMITENDDGTYTVTLQGVGPFAAGAQVRVTAAIATNEGRGSPVFAAFGDSLEVEGETVYETWPIVIEKAWAKFKGGYAGIGDFYSSTAFSFIGGGRAEGYDPRDMSPEAIVALLREAESLGQGWRLGLYDLGGKKPANRN